MQILENDCVADRMPIRLPLSGYICISSRVHNTRGVHCRADLATSFTLR
jgi:hypothetical protein